MHALGSRNPLSAGSFDPTFGTAGLVTTSFPGSSAVTGLVVQPDGKLVAVGASGTTFALERYNPDGTPDTAELAYGLFLRCQADSTGLNDFTTALANGARNEQVLATIVGSDEYFRRI